MTDRYASFANSAPGRALVKRLGLPRPPELRRYRPGEPLVAGPVLTGGATGGRLGDTVQKILDAAGVAVIPAGEPAAALAAEIYDATGIAESGQLRGLYDFFHPYARSLASSGRVLVLGTPPEACQQPRAATAQRALEGFVRSVGKEFGRGTTANLVYVSPGAESAVESTLRFLLSAKSAYVSGQVIRIGTGAATSGAVGSTPAGADAASTGFAVPPVDWDRPLADKVALVTGAAQGIGAAVARVLARDGAQVVVLDVPASGDALSTVANDLKGTALQLDITAADAPVRVAEHIATRHGQVDVVVHNAGVTRDKTIARMAPELWDAVLGVNLSSPERINDELLARDLVAEGGRLIGVSSINGISGTRGQTNYATSKAGVIGLVQSLAPVLASQGITVNAVAPGFIETPMTAPMPAVPRELGRRLNSMAQGGLPVDVAETIAWFASPASAAVTGNVIRVCGQSLLGA